MDEGERRLGQGGGIGIKVLGTWRRSERGEGSEEDENANEHERFAGRH